jgi:hypothetical protein
VLALPLLFVSASACSGSDGFAARFGQRAVDLARHVPGCSGVKPSTGAKPGTGTSATCRILGHGVEIFAYANSAAAKGSATVFGPGAGASGKTWFATVDSGGMRVQRRIATKIASALGGKVEIYR